MADQTKVTSGALDSRTLAHQLNNDLGIIIAECELLESGLKNEVAGTSARLKEIRMAARRMADRISAGPWPTTISTSQARKPSQQRSH